MIWCFHRDALRIVSFWLISGGTTLAQQGELEVRAPSEEQIDVAPGRMFTTSVVVVNRSDEFLELEGHLELPHGCQAVAPSDPSFRLEAGEQALRILVVRIAETVASGRINLVYTVGSRERPSLSGEVRIAVQVAAVDKLELVVEPRSRPVLGGDAYPVNLFAVNRGNNALEVRLAHRSSLGMEVVADATNFQLQAGETRAIVCRVQTDETFRRHAHHAVTFDLTAVSTSGATLSASQASVTEIIPLVSGAARRFHQLPVLFRQTAVVREGHQPKFQTEISGFGSLDEAGERHVDFLFRGPSLEESRFFGVREQYGVSYSDNRWDLALGDRVYSLSPLTEKRSFGRGAAVGWNGERVSVGGFYMGTRHRSRNVDQWGAFVKRIVTEDLSLQANFLHKSGGGPLSSQSMSQDIVSLESRHRIGERHDLRLEAALGSRAGNGGGNSAYRVEARGRLPGQLSYALEHARAGPNFHGYYSDTETTFASFAKPITQRVRTHASINRHAANLARNDVRSSIVNRENSWNAGVTFEQSSATDFWIEWQHTERADILEPVAYDFSEDATRVGVGQRLGDVYARSYIDFGTLDNKAEGETGSFRRYGSSINWSPDAGQTYSLNGSYGPSASTGAMDTTLSAGVSGRWQFNKRVSGRLSYTRNKFDGLTGREFDQTRASVDYEFEDKSSVSLVGRWSSVSMDTEIPTHRSDAAVLLTYTKPFNAPVARRRSIGALRGRLFDETKGRGAGLARVVVQVGDQYAVTDEEGRFEFPSLKPGAQEIDVLQDSLGPRMAMSAELPMKVLVRPAETIEVELPAAPASSMAVRVMRYAFSDGDSVTTSGSVREQCGQGAVTVEISNGRRTWRAQTDRKGFVAFDRLAGGRWVLRVASAHLPPLHAIEDPTRAIALKPGQHQEVSVRVLPERRTLRLIDSGEVRGARVEKSSVTSGAAKSERS